MDRTKRRIADLDAKIREDAGDVDQRESLRHATNRLRELATAIGPELAGAGWHRRQEIIRTLVQRVEIGPDTISIVFRVTQQSGGSRAESIVVSLARPRRQASQKCTN
jgi:hypothetical protein